MKQHCKISVNFLRNCFLFVCQTPLSSTRLGFLSASPPTSMFQLPARIYTTAALFPGCLTSDSVKWLQYVIRLALRPLLDGSHDRPIMPSSSSRGEWELGVLVVLRSTGVLVAGSFALGATAPFVWKIARMLIRLTSVDGLPTILGFPSHSVFASLRNCCVSHFIWIFYSNVFCWLSFWLRQVVVMGGGFLWAMLSDNLLWCCWMAAKQNLISNRA